MKNNENPTRKPMQQIFYKIETNKLVIHVFETCKANKEKEKKSNAEMVRDVTWCKCPDLYTKQSIYLYIYMDEWLDNSLQKG